MSSLDKMEEFKQKAKELGFTVTENPNAATATTAEPTTVASNNKGKDKKKDNADEEEFNPLRGSGFYSRKKVGFSQAYGEGLSQLKVREFDTIDCDGAVVLACFPSTSLASILSGGYLREQLKLPLVGVISSLGFPPRCIIEKGIPSHSVRIFGDQRLVIMLCEFKIPTSELTHLLATALIDFGERHKSPLITTVEGLPTEDEDPHLRFISTHKELCEALMADGHKALEEAVVGGVTGALLAEGVLADEVDVACLLAPALANMPDAKSAVTVVKAITKFLNEVIGADVEVDTAPLESKAEQLHSTIKNLLTSEKKNNNASMSMYG